MKALLFLLISVSTVLGSELDALLNQVSPEIKKWATVIEVGEEASGTLKFDWHHYGDSADSVAFWPASTIKIYTVIAALEYLNELEMPMDSALIFERKTEGEWHLDCARSMREMISEVFRRSSNEDYTLLLRFVGVDRINSQFLIPERGFPHSALMRGYVRGRPYGYVREETQRVTVRAPDGRTAQVEHVWSGRSYSNERGATVISAATGNCTSTHELAECVRRLMFHETLPHSERFRLTPEQLRFVREGGDGLTGFRNELAGAFAWKDAVEASFPEAKFYHKGGLISTHTLDAAFVDDAKSGKRFVVVVAANSGKTATVKEMSRKIAAWIKAR